MQENLDYNIEAGDLASLIFDSCQAEKLLGRKDAHRKPPRILGAALDG
jgi:hypothetical protein